MAVTAGYKAAVKLSGTSTAFTAEACTLVSGTTYRITDATKSVWDRSVVPVVKDGTTVVTPTVINYLRGTVTLASAPAGAVTVSGNYLPMTFAAGCKAWEASWDRDYPETTHFTETGTASPWRTREVGGLLDCSATLTFDFINDPYFSDALKNGTPVFVELYPDAGGTPHVGWYKVPSQKVNATPENLVGRTVELVLDAGGAYKSFDLAGTATL